MTALRTLRLGATALAMTIAIAGTAVAQEKITLRISTPAVPGDWHTEGLYIFKEWLERSAQNQFDVQVFPNATLLKQGTEPIAMQRGNLDNISIPSSSRTKRLIVFNSMLVLLIVCSSVRIAEQASRARRGFSDICP